ncbi:hypothetical protein PPYR_13962 [Photinus pyralis]|uniref:Uncharacterized protein n=1 Tax=Photinus pyralis TaxID=7054 RepID=A0A5N4A3X2_PHOPY|nr:hypothetical protein PPYR_13962 [Photinus pyralis]
MYKKIVRVEAIRVCGSCERVERFETEKNFGKMKTVLLLLVIAVVVLHHAESCGNDKSEEQPPCECKIGEGMWGSNGEYHCMVGEEELSCEEAEEKYGERQED